jgi:hypothetical protein
MPEAMIRDRTAPAHKFRWNELLLNCHSPSHDKQKLLKLSFFISSQKILLASLFCETKTEEKKLTHIWIAHELEHRVTLYL